MISVHTKHAYPTMTTSSTHKMDTFLNACVHSCILEASTFAYQALVNDEICPFHGK